MWPIVIPVAAAGVYLLIRELTAEKPSMPPLSTPTPTAPPVYGPSGALIPEWILHPEDVPTTPGVTIAADLPPTDLPTGAETWNDIDDRFRNIVLTNWRTGHWDEMETLTAANLLLADLKKLGFSIETDKLAIEIKKLIKTVGESPA